MLSYEIGDWVKGPFANTTVEGFITNETYSTYSIRINQIGTDCNRDELPKHLRIGSIHELPKRVIREFYRVFNKSQQHNLVKLAIDLGQQDWANQLIAQFHNPDSSSRNRNDKVRNMLVYSSLLNKMVSIGRPEQKQLYAYYEKVKAKGMTGRIQSPDEINHTDAFDAVITAIVLVAKDRQGMDYIQEIVNGRDKAPQS